MTCSNGESTRREKTLLCDNSTIDAVYQVNGDELSLLDGRLDGGDGFADERAVQLLVGDINGSLRQAGGSVLW